MIVVVLLRLNQPVRSLSQRPPISYHCMLTHPSLQPLKLFRLSGEIPRTRASFFHGGVSLTPRKHRSSSSMAPGVRDLVALYRAFANGSSFRGHDEINGCTVLAVLT